MNALMGLKISTFCHYKAWKSQDSVSDCLWPERKSQTPTGSQKKKYIIFIYKCWKYNPTPYIGFTRYTGN